MDTRVVAAVAVAVVIVGGVALAAFMNGRAPEEASDQNPGAPDAPTPTVPTPTPATPGSDDAPVEELWIVYGKTHGASSLMNVSLEERPEGDVAVVQFEIVNAAGSSTIWSETIRLSTREVEETTNPSAGLGAPAFDMDVGEATWLFVPPNVGVGDEVRIADATVTVERGEDAQEPLPDTWMLCGEVGCYFYDRATGAYVHWESEDEPGWSMIESASADLNSRYGVQAGPPDAG